MKAREGFSKKEKNNVLLSQETLTGISMTGKAFNILLLLHTLFFFLYSVIICWTSEVCVLHT